MQDINKKPGMYRLVFNQTSGEYGLLRDSECVVAEQYGPVLPEVAKWFGDYSKDTVNNTCVLVTGASGFGKTHISRQLCRKSIDAGQSVVDLTETKLTERVIRFLSGLPRITVLFDTIPGYIHHTYVRLFNKMVTDPGRYGRKFVIVTAESRVSVSPELINRVNVIQQYVNTRNISKETLAEYCVGKSVSTSITKELAAFHATAPVFGFGLLIALVRASKQNPGYSLDEIMSKTPSLRLNAVPRITGFKVTDILTRATFKRAVEPTVLLNDLIAGDDYLYIGCVAADFVGARVNIEELSEKLNNMRGSGVHSSDLVGFIGSNTIKAKTSGLSFEIYFD